MKRILYVSWLLAILSPLSARAAVPVTMSGPSPAIEGSYRAGSYTTFVYTITNNVPHSSFPITVTGIADPVSRVTVSNDCGNWLPKGPSTCNIGIAIAPTASNIGQVINQNLAISYQGRLPLTNHITFSVVQNCTIYNYSINENPTPLFPAGSGLIPDQSYVIKDNVGYKFYYAGDLFNSINLATSPDGITWTPYPGNPVLAGTPGQQEHADVHYYSDGFSGANYGTDPSPIMMYYRMWYQGPNNSISGWQYAESPDGITWYNRIPVTQFGPTIFSTASPYSVTNTYGIADAVYTPNASNTGTDWTFRIYANVQWELNPYGGDELVVMAFSANGYEWTGYDPTNVGYATPIFAGSQIPGTFDETYVGWFKVVKNASDNWQAFYSGGVTTTYQAFNGIGYATSSDGINWTRQQTLLTTNDPVPWRSQSTWMPSVVKTNNGYELYFIGSDNPNIGSSDFIQWKLGRAILTQGPCH